MTDNWLEPKRVWNAFFNTETRILTIMGATTAILAIAFLLSLLNLAPEKVILSIYYYTGLPTIFLVLLFQRSENSAFKWDNLALFAYFVIAFVMLIIGDTPKSWHGLLLIFIAYVIGVVTTCIAGIMYVMLYEIDKPTDFKLRMVFAFSITACVMIFIFIILNHFKVFAFLG